MMESDINSNSPKDAPTSSNDPSVTTKWDDSEFQPKDQASWLHRHKLEVISFSTLSLVLLAVVFLLPDAVEQSHHSQPTTAQTTTKENQEKDATDKQTDEPKPNAQAAIKTTTETPWQDAQATKARRQAQEILAQLMDKQNSLEKMQVNLWAAEAFQVATKNAKDGDDLYRSREFIDALAHYETALEQFDALIEQAEQQFQQAMTHGAKAITDQQPQTAIDAYTLATAIRPDNTDAQAGLERAKVQEDVIDHLETADNQMLQYQYEAAKDQVNKALALDSQSTAAAEKLVKINQAIADGNFSSYMGQGYSYLEQGQYSNAITQFRKAQSLQPGNQTVSDAITQASNQQTQIQIRQTLQHAEQLESQEQWQQAVSSYQTAQKLDSSLVAARVGLLRTEARAQLDQQLQSIIDQPLRLADPAVYRNAQQLLSDAQSVKPRGSRIEQQQQQLQQALSKALNPVAVLLRSDNQTQITLYRVGSLGNFKEHALELKPGRYTLVGSRNGYRDVREEFTLQPGTDAKTIVIQCEEKIALGS